MNREELIRDRISYWDGRAKDAIKAADFAHEQLRIHVEELAALGGCAMSEYVEKPHLTLLQGGLSESLDK